MENHFLADSVEGESSFCPEPWYNPQGDCIIFQMADEAVVADRVDELLTVYRSAIDNRPIGYQIKGIVATICKFGFEGLSVTAESDTKSVRSISISALLLAAYEQGPKTIERRQAYATAMDCPGHQNTIDAGELIPA